MTSLPRFAHNDYLHVFAELGLPGFVIILVLAWLIVSKGLNQFHSHLHLGATCGVIAILVHSMVDFNLHLSSNALLFAFLTAICLSDKSFKIHSKFVVPIGAAVLIALVVIVPRHLTLKETGNLLERGRAYIDTKEYSKAITCFSKASVLSPQIAEIFRDLAYSKFQCGKLAAILGLKGKAIGFLDAAIGDYQSALKLNSNDAFVIHWQGICQSEITKITRKHESAVAAINYFRRAHKLDPLNVVYTRWLGTHLMVIGEEDEAMTVLSDLTHNPTTTPSFVNRMLSFTYIYLTDSERIKKKVRLIEDARLAEKEGLALKGTPDAEKTPAQEVSLLVMAKLIKLVPENSEGALLHLAGLYMKDGNWIEARKLYQRALIVAPLSRQVLKSLGAAAMSNDDLELAEKTYTKLLSVWNDYWVSNQLAAVARKRKDTVSEEKWLARGIELAPDQPRPFLAMALFLTRSGDEEKKKKGIEKLQAMSLTYRDFYEAPWHLGLIANSDKDYYRAIEYFTIALKRAPDNVTIKNVMAWTYVRTGLAIKGYRIWDKAIVDHPERFDLILNKASAHYGQREYAHTVECLKEYKKFVPSGKFNGKPLDDEIARISALIKTVERW
jgi:tetratricopeptide (TPR) repeat protein